MRPVAAITPAAFLEEYRELHVVHAHCLLWRMKCQAHRLIEFGYESAVQHLTPPELVVLSMLVPPVMADALLQAVLEHGDERWCAFIRRELPRYAQEAVSA